MYQLTDAEIGGALGEDILCTELATSIFHSIDRNKDGVIDFDELRCELSDTGMSDKKIEELFLSLDTDQSGNIDKEEWVYGYSRFIHQTGRAELSDLRGPTGGCKIEDTASRAIELEQLEKIYQHVKQQLKRAPWKVSRPSRNTGEMADVQLTDPKKVNLYDVTSD